MGADSDVVHRGQGTLPLVAHAHSGTGRCSRQGASSSTHVAYENGSWHNFSDRIERQDSAQSIDLYFISHVLNIAQIFLGGGNRSHILTFLPR